jgi:hypothetical protein
MKKEAPSFYGQKEAEKLYASAPRLRRRQRPQGAEFFWCLFSKKNGLL